MGLSIAIPPVVIVGVASITLSSRSIATQVEIARQEQLKTTGRVVASRLAEVDQAILQLTAGPDAATLAWAEEINTTVRLAVRSVIDRTQELVNRYSLINAIALVDLPRGHVTSDTLVRHEEYEHREVYRSLRNDQEVVFLRSVGADGIERTTMLRRFYVFGRTQPIHIAVTLRSAELFEPLAVPSISGAYVVHTMDGKVIFSAFSPHGREPTRGSYGWETADDRTVFSTTVPTIGYGLLLSFIEPRSQLFKSARDTARILAVFIIAIGAATTVATYLVSRTLYSPLLDLVQMVERNERPGTEPGPFNDYAMLRDTLSWYSEEIPVLKTRAELARRYERRYGLAEQITGATFSTETFETLAAEIGLELESRVFYLSLLVVESQDQLSTVESVIQSHLLSLRVGQESVLCRESSSRLLLFSATAVGYSYYLDDLAALISSAYRSGIKCTLTASTPFYFIEDLPAFYKNICERASDDRFFGSNQRIITTTPFQRPALRDSEATTLRDRIVSGVRRRDATQAQCDLHELVLLLKSKHEPVAYARHELGRMAHEILTLIRSLGLESNHEIGVFDLYSKVDAAPSLDDIETELRRLIDIAVGDTQESINEHHRVIVHRIQEFVSANYQKDISLRAIADSALVSTGYMCSVFKNATGRTVLEAVTLVRLERARELLAQPRLTIADIAVQVGYRNTQSLVRFFRKHYQLSPSEYRANLRATSV